MADALLQKRIADLLLRPSSGPELIALCKELGVSEADAPKLAIYRRLVRGNLHDVCEQMMPRTRDLLGEKWDETFAAFLEDVGPRTHYLRDVPHELYAFAEARWRKDEAIAPYACDLAAWELAFYAVSAAPHEEKRTPGDLALDRAVLFDDAVRSLRLHWSVHEETFEEREVSLLLYRDAENLVRTLELTPLAANLTERLLRGETLGDATKSACVDLKMELTPEVLGSIAKLLADFGERGALLGSKEPIEDRV